MDDKIVLTGDLEFLSLADVFQLLGANNSSGILRITSKYAPEPGIVYFTRGNPVNASTSSHSGLDAVFALFGWTQGEFVFSRAVVNVARVIKKSRMEIILDALRMLDDGLIETLGTDQLSRKLSMEISENGVASTIIKGPLVDYMYVVDEEEFYQGERIIEEGKHGNWIWIVLEGCVDIVKETAQGPLTVLKLGDGAFIGSLDSLLTRGSRRSASAIARTNVQLGVLDSMRLAKEYAAMSPELREILISLDRRLRKVTRRYGAIHENPNLAQNALGGVRRLINQGENEELLYKILSGKAMVAKHTAHQMIPLAELGSGDYFGNMPFVDMGHEPYSASVFAHQELETAPVDAAKLQNEYESLSLTFRNIVDNVATCISATSTIMCNMAADAAHR